MQQDEEQVDDIPYDDRIAIPPQVFPEIQVAFQVY
jgi:hypothetical protein